MGSYPRSTVMLNLNTRNQTQYVRQGMDVELLNFFGGYNRDIFCSLGERFGCAG